MVLMPNVCFYHRLAGLTCPTTLSQTISHFPNYCFSGWARTKCKAPGLYKGSIKCKMGQIEILLPLHSLSLVQEGWLLHSGESDDMTSTASLQGPLGNSEEDRGGYLHGEILEAGTFQILASLAKAFSREKKGKLWAFCMSRTLHGSCVSQFSDGSPWQKQTKL